MAGPEKRKASASEARSLHTCSPSQRSTWVSPHPSRPGSSPEPWTCATATRTQTRRDDEQPVAMLYSRFLPWKCVCFITAGPSTKLFAWGGRRVEDICYERRRAKSCVD